VSHLEALWLGLVGATETDRPEEWPLVQWAVRRRVEAKGRFRDDVAGVVTVEQYDDVVLDDWQFSAFNAYRNRADTWSIYREVSQTIPPQRVALATDCAKWVLGTPERGAPFGPRVYYFYSPISMKPPGSLPKWNWEKLRRFAMPGIDPYRFVFAEEK